MSEAISELSSFFDRSAFEEETYRRYADAVFATARDRERFEALLSDQTAAGARPLAIGVGCLVLCRFSDALEWLGKAPNDRYKHYYSARAALGLARFDEAIGSFQKAAAAGWDALLIDMQIAAALLRKGQGDQAEALHRKHERGGSDRAAWYHAGGLLAEVLDEREKATELFEKALALDSECDEAAFRAARLCDVSGDDERAVELYEGLAARPRAAVNAMINLAVLYEDRGRFDEALRCLRCVLALYPNHARARLFFKDVQSSREMLMDEALEQRADRRNRLLETPITELEITVRSRNCLKKMNVRNVGDLVRLTEAELLTYKNFGETSLNEIRAVLAKRGLQLGQQPDEIDAAALPEPPPAAPKVVVPPGAETLLSKPVAELELSVRSRRCLQRLNIVTLSDLIQHSEGELLAARNFGQTSLNEIKSRLGELGLTLAPRQ